MNPVPGAYYNIGGTHTTTVKEILDTLIGFSPMKDRIEVEVDPERLRPIDADLQVPDTTKFRKHTGWKPQIPYETTMLDLLEYWRMRIRRDGNRFLVR
jgi:GDPmannose 4,6-dehydratase